MSKTFRKMLVMLMAVAMVFTMSAVPTFAADTDSEAKLVDGEFELEDGQYVLSKADGSTIKNPLTCEKLVVKDGNITGYFTTTSKSMTHVYLGEKSVSGAEATELYDPETGALGENVYETTPIMDGDAVSGMEITLPVQLNEDVDISVRTVAMSKVNWIAYKYHITFEPEYSTELNVNNITDMFKVDHAALNTKGDDEYLVIELSGPGYHELFKGTYEEAEANGTNTDNWIHGYQNDNGKWEFKVPVSADETFIPMVAISNRYYEKYLNGENPIERSFYARQMELDRETNTLSTDDFHKTETIAITNNISMFKPADQAELRTDGGPNNNGYGHFMTLPMTTDSMTKVRAVKYNKGVEDGYVEIELGDDQAFKDIPVKDGLNVLEFFSKKNQIYYKRAFTLNIAEKKGVFDPYKAQISEFEGMTEEEAVEYAKNYGSEELLQALIEAIQVQYRDENTDMYCAAAKACYDKLAKDNPDDDGYFSDPTGDASLDDPLNQDNIGENELLVVSFGTSFNESRATDIGGVEKALQAAYPEWSVRRAFTAQIIINHVQARDGEKIDNVKQALDRAVANGVKNLVVQPTHLMHGAEYDELMGELNNYKDKFNNIIVAEPLLGEVGENGTTVNADKETAAKAMVAEAVKVAGAESLEALDNSGTAIVFMGHGTGHDAAVTYDQMQEQMKQLGYKNVFVGTVEGNPADTALPEVKKAVEKAGYTKVILRPMMVVAGDHANNDMAADEEGSWYYGFVNGGEFEVEGADEAVNIGEGFGAENVTCQIEGLGRIADIQKMYVAHTGDVILKSISAAKVTGLPNVTYTGKAFTPSPKVTLDGVELVKDTDYTVSYKNNTKVGTATVTLKGIGNYIGTKTATFKINAASIKGAKIGSVSAKTYTGKAFKPSPSVTVNGKKLVKDRDYTVTYKNNKNAGKATIIFNGIGNYTGKETKTFTINKAKNTMTVTAKTGTVKYTKLKKANQTLKVAKVLTVKNAKGKLTYTKKSGNKKILINKTTGKVTVKKGLKKGTYKVKVAVKAAGTANYKAKTLTKTFKVKVA